MGEVVTQSSGLAGRWTRFRQWPTWVQLIAWIVAWPLLAALVLVSPPGGPAPARMAAAAMIVMVAGPLWLMMLFGVGDDLGTPTVDEVADAEDRDDPEDNEPAEHEDGEPEGEPEPEPASEPELVAELWTVTNVVDGDTVDVQAGDGTEERVRIIGIDTPERGECGFNRATAAMATLVLNQEVELVAGARDDRDHYGRILRYLDVDGTDAGLVLIEKGLAISRYDSRDGYGKHAREDRYVVADHGLQLTCSRPEPLPRPSREPNSGGPGSGPGGAWKNCTEARENGAAPVHRGDPGYGNHLDRDQDGIGCE